MKSLMNYLNNFACKNWNTLKSDLWHNVKEIFPGNISSSKLYLNTKWIYFCELIQLGILWFTSWLFFRYPAGSQLMPFTSINITYLGKAVKLWIQIKI